MLKLLFEKGDSSKIRPDLVRKCENIISRLDASNHIKDMNSPNLRLHKLKVDLKEFWAVTVKENWRIIFQFENGDASVVDLIDYH